MKKALVILTVLGVWWVGAAPSAQALVYGDIAQPLAPGQLAFTFSANNTNRMIQSVTNHWAALDESSSGLGVELGLSPDNVVGGLLLNSDLADYDIHARTGLEDGWGWYWGVRGGKIDGHTSHGQFDAGVGTDFALGSLKIYLSAFMSAISYNSPTITHTGVDPILVMGLLFQMGTHLNMGGELHLGGIFPTQSGDVWLGESGGGAFVTYGF